MGIEENLALAKRRGKTRFLKPGITKKEREEYKELLKILGLGLEDRLTSKVGLLSGGQRQALTLLMATMNPPKLLLLDEPSMGLAPILVDEIFSMIQTINSAGTTILLVEQNANKALRIANRGYVLETGKIKLHGTSEELLTNDEVRTAYLGG